ncbi:MAG: 3-phosphoshikimate 1-carboxyvinyltransferase [Phycisphaerae bacterium]
MNLYRCIQPDGPLDADIAVPGSKSISNRALVTAALADGTTLLTNVLIAEDTRLMIDGLASLGVSITVDAHTHRVEVTGCGGHVPADEADIFCGNAGTVMRFLAAVAAVGHGRYRLDGVPRMRERPIRALADVLQALGAGIAFPSADGFPPVEIRARHLTGGHVAFDTPESSQFVSAVLLAGPYARRDVLIDVRGAVTSAPYLTMTTAVMDAFGVAVVERYHEHGARFIVEASQRYTGRTYAIEPDASNAMYFLAAPAIAGGRVTVKGLGTESIQGDVGFVDVLERMGCRVRRGPSELTVAAPESEAPLRGVDVDLNDMPDTAPTLAVLAVFATGSTTIRNVANLRVKETDRITALATELTKLGASVDERDDGLTIHPPTAVAPAAIDTYRDHRIAMSFALAGLRCPGLVIHDPDCCAKTCPDFFTRWTRMVTPA